MGNYVQHVLDGLDAQDLGLDQALTDLYALLVLVRGEAVTLKDVHDAWAIWRNRSNPEHQSLVPFDQLSEHVQEMDRPYAEAIAQAAAEQPGTTT